MKKALLIVLVVSLICPIIANAKTKDDKHQYDYQGKLSDNHNIEIVIVSSSDKSKIESAMKKVASWAEDTENVIKSDISKLDGKWNDVHPETADFLMHAVNLSVVTDGWFDITSPSPKHWFTKRDYRRINLIEDPPTAQLRSSNMKFDIDLFLSAFIVDKAAKKIIDQGYSDGWVAIGTIQRGWGNNLYTPWSVQIPRDKLEDSFAYRAKNYGLRNAGWVTITGNIPLTDAKNKKEITPWYLNLTVVAKEAKTAVAFAIVTASQGPKYGPQFLEIRDEVEGVIITNNGQLIASHAFRIASPYQSTELTGDRGPKNLSLKRSEEASDIIKSKTKKKDK